MMIEEKNINRERKIKRPIGLTILLVYLIFGVVSFAVELFQDADHVMLFGYIGQGIKFKLIGIIYLILSILFIIGLCRYQRWAYYGFMISLILVFILSIRSVIFIDTNRIIEVGWRLRSVYFGHGLNIIGTFVVFLWLANYGDKFLSPTDRFVRFFRERINNSVAGYFEKD